MIQRSFRPRVRLSHLMVVALAAAMIAPAVTARAQGLPTGLYPIGNPQQQQRTQPMQQMQPMQQHRMQRPQGFGQTMALPSLQGTLSTSDRVGPNGRYEHEHVVSLRAGEPVAIDLSSEGFDTFLIVQSPSRRRLENDDIVQGNLNSRLAFTAPETGRYTIVVTSYQPGATGYYQLDVARGAQAQAQSQAQARAHVQTQPFVQTQPYNRTQPPDVSRIIGNAVAGRRGAGRIRGVFVGIDEYQNGNNLQGCADDARRLAQAFFATGAMASSDAIVLTNRAATTGAVRQAIAQIGGRTSQNDVFVFFFSGHGNQVSEVRRGDEADGQDETIVLYDASLRDDDLDRALDGIQADTTLVALDSCHSGGFARDLEQGRRIGLYSSEEGVLSQVAPRYGAGGFLSHFLERAVAGDARGPNGAVRVGDLTNYLQREFGSHRDEMRTTDAAGFDTNQNLIVTRGAALTDMLWQGGRRAATLAMR